MAEILFIGDNGGIRTRAGMRVGMSLLQNPLNEDVAMLPGDSQMLIVSSGRMDEPHRTWGPQGATAFNAWCDRLRAWKRGGGNGKRSVLIRPHCLDVLSDIQRCVSFARAEKGGLEIAMDPVGLLAPSMLEKAADHLVRFRDAIEQRTAIGAIVLTNVKVDQRGECVPTPIHAGQIAVELLRPFAALSASWDVPLVLVAGEGAAQQQAVVGAGDP